MARKRSEALVPVGKKIRRVRLDQKITLEQVANETGYSTDFLKKIEAGKVIPPVGSLLQVARALRIDSGDLLKQDAAALRKRASAYSKRTENYAYTTLTPAAQNKHMKAFRVAVEPLRDHRGVDYQHEGEEFVYVLKGQIEVAVGDHRNTLREGESLHFNSGIRHKLKNTAEEEAELLVVIYNP